MVIALPCRGIVLGGSPGDEIVRYTESLGDRLIVSSIFVSTPSLVRGAAVPISWNEWIMESGDLVQIGHSKAPWTEDVVAV